MVRIIPSFPFSPSLFQSWVLGGWTYEVEEQRVNGENREFSSRLGIQFFLPHCVPGFSPSWAFHLLVACVATGCPCIELCPWSRTMTWLIPDLSSTGKWAWVYIQRMVYDVLVATAYLQRTTWCSYFVPSVVNRFGIGPAGHKHIGRINDLRKIYLIHLKFPTFSSINDKRKCVIRVTENYVHKHKVSIFMKKITSFPVSADGRSSLSRNDVLKRICIWS